MAKNAGRLAGLAALAGAAYMMSRGKGKSDDAGDQKTSSYVKDTKKVEAKDESFKPTNESAYASRSNMTPMQGVGDAKNDPIVKPAPAPAPAPAPVVTNTPSAPPAQVNRDMKDATKQKVLDALNQRAGANTPSALRSDQLADVSRAVKREEKTKKAAQADFPDYKATFKNPETQKRYDKVEKQTGSLTSSAMKTDAMKVASRAAKAADAKRRAAKQSSFKSGGAVKMASGGMTASRRADGIATKGKTKCKMY
jgi:hypothetical protein